MQQVVRGNIFGLIAILLWSVLASLVVAIGKIPPFELVSVSFWIAFFVGIVFWKFDGRSIKLYLKIPFGVWLVGVGGLFGYHFFYFLALQNAPAAEANLINYLWPLFIVLFSSFLPGVKLRWFHALGVSMGFLGVLVLFYTKARLHMDMQYIKGYFYAFLSALIWSLYSVFSKFFNKVSTGVVGSFCGVTAILATICHFLFEVTVIPDLREFVFLLLLGLGPAGGAFFAWDYGVKRGDIQILGVSSYIIPLLSTVFLVLLGFSKSNGSIWLSCIFIVMGSIIASLPLFKKLF